MKKIMLGLAIALATPAVAHAAEELQKPCWCCKEVKDGCGDKKGQNMPDHHDHKEAKKG